MYFYFTSGISVLTALLTCCLALAQEKNLAYYDSHETEILPDAEAAFHNGNYERAIVLCRWNTIINGDTKADDLRKKSETCAALSREVRGLNASGRTDLANEKARALMKINRDDPNAVKVVVNGPARGTLIGHEWVNLGLSVNWATCNVGAESPNRRGLWYAWGETSYKPNPTWENYIFRKSGSSEEDITYTKYNCDTFDSDYSKINRGPIDNKRELESSDDAAFANWGNGWRMPTWSEINELLDCCTWQFTSQDGQSGYLVTSKRTGNSIFLPSTFSGDVGYYWTSSLNPLRPFNSFIFGFEPSGPINRWMTSNRVNQLSVRPVTEVSTSTSAEMSNAPTTRTPKIIILSMNDLFRCNGKYVPESHDGALYVDLGPHFHRSFFSISFEYSIIRGSKKNPNWHYSKFSSEYLDNRTILSFDTGRRSFELRLGESRVVVATNNSDNYFETSIDIEYETWQRIDLVYDSGRLIVNGKVLDIGPLNVGDNNVLTSMGFSNGSAFNGYIRNLVVKSE